MRHNKKQKIRAVVREYDTNGQPFIDGWWRAVSAAAVGKDTTSDDVVMQKRATAAIARFLERCCADEIESLARFRHQMEDFTVWYSTIDATYGQLQAICADFVAPIWEIASRWLDREPAVAMAYLARKDAGLARAETLGYFTRLLGSRRGSGAGRVAPGRWEWVPTMLNAFGGARHFVRFALALYVAELIVAAFDISRGAIFFGRLDDAVVTEPSSLKILGEVAPLFNDPFRSRIETLISANEDHRQSVIQILREQSRIVCEVFSEFRKGFEYLSERAKVAEREAEQLRRRLASTEVAITDLRSQLAARQDEANTLRRKQLAIQPGAEGGAANAELRAELKEALDRGAAMRESHDQLNAELSHLREFVTLLLEDSGAHERDTGDTVDSVDPDKWRVVFVGGHERLHSKLRREMRNAVFLHPDRSHIDADVFNNADCAIFYVGYCSHTLALRAANEVRKRGLRAGYTTHVNVDKVMADVRHVMGR